MRYDRLKAEQKDAVTTTTVIHLPTNIRQRQCLEAHLHLRTQQTATTKKKKTHTQEKGPPSPITPLFSRQTPDDDTVLYDSTLNVRGHRPITIL